MSRSRILLLALIITQCLGIRAGRYMIAITLIFALLVLVLYRPRMGWYVTLGFCLALALTVIGLTNGNDLYQIAGDIVIFSPLLVALLGRPEAISKLDSLMPRVFARSAWILIPAGILIFAYMGYGIVTEDSARFSYDESVKLEFFAPTIPLGFAPFLVFYWRRLGRWERAAVIVALSMIAVMGAITLSRSVILGALIPVLLVAVSEVRLGRVYVVRLLTIAAVLGTAGWYIVSQNPTGRELTRLILLRTETQSETGDITSSRWTELQELLSQHLTVSEYALGRGYGGSKVRRPNDSFIGGRNMMHIGPAHVFLKGGLLLVLYLYVPAIGVIARYWRTDRQELGLMMLLFLIGNAQTTNWDLSYALFFYWYVIAAYLNRPKYSFADAMSSEA